MGAVRSFILWLVLAGAAQAVDTLRIMTFNVAWLASSASESDRDPWENDEDLDRHLRRVAAAIASSRPHVALLAEVLSRTAAERLAALLRERGLDFSVEHVESDDTATGQDVVFLTRITPDTVEGRTVRKYYSPRRGGRWRSPYRYPVGGGRALRGHTSVSKNAVLFLTWKGRRLGLLGLHLIAGSGDARRNAQRTGQAMVARRILSHEIAERGYFPVVLGDLNDFDPDFEDADPGADTRTQVLALLKDFDSSRPGPELFNAAGAIPDAGLRYSAYRDLNRNGRRDPGEPAGLIDHILLDVRLRPEFLRVYVDHSHNGGLPDHWPLIVEITR